MTGYPSAADFYSARVAEAHHVNRVAFLGGCAGGYSGRGWAGAGGTKARRIYHFVARTGGEFAAAVCGTRPGRTSAGWFDVLEDGARVDATCRRCRKAAGL